jgi:hypothetical protein
MSSFNARRAYGPRDLEIIQRAYDQAWAIIECRKPNRDHSKDEALKRILRKRIFESTSFGIADPVVLRNRALGAMPEYSTQAKQQRIRSKQPSFEKNTAPGGSS